MPGEAPEPPPAMGRRGLRPPSGRRVELQGGKIKDWELPMNEQMECMCTHCGVSIFIDRELLACAALAGSDRQVVCNTACEGCGGTLLVIGRAGDEPCYRVE
jgi:hypothetical protein